MDFISTEKILEPGYGYCQIEKRNGIQFAFKTFYAKDLRDFEDLLQRLMKRQKIKCEYMIKLLEIDPRLSQLTILSGFEYFSQDLKNLRPIIRESAFDFLSFTSQILFFWNFLRKRSLYLSNFEFNSIRYDHKNKKYKIIDELEIVQFNDTWTVHMKDVELFLFSVKCDQEFDQKEIKRTAVALAIGLIFMALLFEEDMWNSTKRAIINRDFHEYKFWALRFLELPKTKELINLAGKELFISTVFAPEIRCIRSPFLLLQELKFNLLYSMNPSRSAKPTASEALVKAKSDSTQVAPPSTTDLSNNDTFTMISRKNSSQVKGANLQFLMEQASVHDPLGLLVSHINGFISQINNKEVDPCSLTDVNLLETIKKRDKTETHEKTKGEEKVKPSETYTSLAYEGQRDNVFKTSLPKLTTAKYPLKTKGGSLKSCTEPPTPAFKSLEDESEYQASSLSQQTIPISSFSDKTDCVFDNIKQVRTVNFDLQSVDNLLSDFSESVVNKVCFKKLEEDRYSLLESMQMKTKLFDY